MAKRWAVVVGVAGSIACYKACEVVRDLAKLAGVEVHVVMTREATQFVTPLTFQTLSGRKTYADLFEAPEGWDLLHTSLAAAADLVLVYPATMNLLGKLAHGICDDLVTSVVFATKAPVIIAPAMHQAMYAHPATQANLAMLKRYGYSFLGPIRGDLARPVRPSRSNGARGAKGMGHVIEPPEAVQAVRQRLRLK